jgi:hypothetical protein
MDFKKPRRGRHTFFIIALVYVIWGAWGHLGYADVTGSFGIQVSFAPIACQSVIVQSPSVPLGDQPCESTVFKLDFETDLTINITISGLIIGLHSHAGVTGFEDVILSFAATLGGLEVKDTFVFAQPYGLIVAGDGQTIPACYENEPGSGTCDTLFVKKRVEVTLSFGGVTLSNLALFEDVNFPSPGATKPLGAVYTAQSQSFGFGDVFTLEGQTPSGITLLFQTGFCAENKSNSIKKHSFSFSVNPDCVAGAQTPSLKPPLFFDFEKVAIQGIPIAASLTTEFTALCTGVLTCSFTNSFALTSTILFSLIKVSFTFENITGPFTFSSITLQLQSAPLTLTLVFSSLLELTSVSATVALTLNPDTNPASLSLSLSGSPGQGINSLKATLGVVRGGLTLSIASSFVGENGAVKFSKLTLGAVANVDMLQVEADIGLEPTGIANADLGIVLNF